MKKNNLYNLIIILLFPLFVVAQQTVSGTVKGTDGSVLPGTTVLEKGTTNGVVTDFDGKYVINLNNDNATLVFSYVGFIRQEAKVNGRSVINIVLEEDSQQLNEVVVIGYGTVERKDLTGSISSVKPDENALVGTRGIEGYLQGRVAGVQVSSLGTEPGAPSSIKIRGTGTLTTSSEPLYVIDGVIVDSANEETLNPLSGANNILSAQQGIAGINPRDIESYEVLKDASATAIYGSRASNGVILITTKKGKKGKAKFTYSNTTRIGNITRNIDMLNTDEYVSYQNDLQNVLGNAPKFYVYPDRSFASFMTSEQYMVDNAATIERLQGIDWSKDTYRTAVSSNHRISASGGGDNGTYYFAGGYSDVRGIIPRSYAKTYDFVVNINQDLNEKLKLASKISTTYIKNSASKGTEGLGDSRNSMVKQILDSAPILNYQPNIDNIGVDEADYIDGPRAWIADYDDLSDEIRLQGSLRLTYKLSKVFTWQTLFGGDYRRKQRKLWYGTSLFRGAQVNGEAGMAVLDRFRFNIDNTLMFRKRFNKNHRIDGTIGIIVDRSKKTQSANRATNFDLQDLRADGISFGTVFDPTIYSKEEEAILSFIGRLNYAIKDRYLFTATFRADGSSKFFTKERRWGYFPAFAFAWKMKEEAFLRDVESVTEAKIRLGWGRTGNQNIPNYRYLTPYGSSYTSLPDGGGGILTSLVPQNLANEELKWETTEQYNAGIDLGFLNNRFTTTIDVYYKNVNNLLFNVQIPASNGFSQYYTNLGDMTNQGLEVSVSADVIDKKFKWNIFGNISFNKNKITNLGIAPAPWGTETYSAYLGEQVSGGNYFKVPANIFIQGQPTALFWGYQTNGIISNDQILANAPNFQGVAPHLGDILYVDRNGDGNVTDADQAIIGNTNPDFVYGFGTELSLGGLSLSVFFNGVYGNDIANGTAFRDAYSRGNSNDNIRTTGYYDAWSPTNTNGTNPRLGYDVNDTTIFSDRFVEDGSFLRLSNVTLAYQLPAELIPGINSASISISGQNLWLLSDYTGFDPEVNSFSFDPSRVGIDWNSFPNQRSFTLGLNVSF